MKYPDTKKVLLTTLLGLTLLVGSSFKSDFFEIAKQIEIFTTLFKELNMNYVDETNPAALMDTAIKNMLNDLDPYTKFLNEQDVEEYKIKNAGEYSGIGAIVRTEKDKIVIVEPRKDYPADKAGLKAGDQIIEIGDVKVAESEENATELLKGTQGSQVDITYLRQGKSYTATVERSGVEVEAVPFYEMVDEKTGYIVLSTFNRKATTQVKSAIIDLKTRGATQLILDLRGNPGGLLTEAINVTNLFVPKGQLLVSTKSKVKKFNKEYYTQENPLDSEIPIAVLINDRSASASEIVAGSLQDLDRAVILGSRSFGKGLVQRPLKLTYGTQLKVTISRYYTPSGRCIQALDYSERDEEGNAKRKTQFNSFKTKNGREVKDGGGVMPDVEIQTAQTNDLIQALENNHLIFDFATDFYYQKTYETLAQFDFNDEDYNRFVAFVNTKGFSYETSSEKLLAETINKEADFLGIEVQSQYKNLLLSIDNAKLLALKKYRKELETKIIEQLVLRYFYREGLYQYKLKNDDAILTACSLFKDKTQLDKILK